MLVKVEYIIYREGHVHSRMTQVSKFRELFAHRDLEHCLCLVFLPIL